MLIIHILVGTSQVLTQDDNVVEDIIILYDQQQIYLHLLLQDQNTSIQISKHLNYINYIFHELLFMLRL